MPGFLKQSTLNNLQDLIWDFQANGPYNKSLILEPENLSLFSGTGGATATDSSNTPDLPRRRWQIRFLINNNELPSLPIWPNPNAQVLGGIYFTRTTQNYNGTSKGIWGNDFPYLLSFLNPTTYNIRVELWHKPNQDFKGAVSWQFSIFQKAVAVTKINSLVGPNIINYSTLNNVVTGTTTINKSLNRGDDLESVFKIQKLSGGVWVNTVIGVDYTLSGPLTDDTLSITWLNNNTYKIENSVKGSTSTTAGTNQDLSVFYVEVNDDFIATNEQVTLPNVNTVITKAPIYYNQSQINSIPFNGIENFIIDVSFTLTGSRNYVLERTNVLNNQILPSIDFGANYTDADWIDEIEKRCVVQCVVTANNNVIQVKNGLRNHRFVLTEGNYNVGYIITPK